MKHLYKNGVTDWFIAETKKEAVSLAREHYLSCGMSADEMDLDLKMVPDESPFKYDPKCNYQFVVKKAVEFAKDHPKGIFATTEY